MKKVFIYGNFVREKFAEAYMQFKAAENSLSKLGFDTVNPMNHISEHTPDVEILKRSIMLMMDCEAIFIYPDWKGCANAGILFELAYKLKYEIFMPHDLDHLKQMQLLSKGVQV